MLTSLSLDLRIISQIVIAVATIVTFLWKLHEMDKHRAIMHRENQIKLENIQDMVARTNGQVIEHEETLSEHSERIRELEIIVAKEIK